jgi:C_GCAxxG_C_C family probable redox protein
MMTIQVAQRSAELFQQGLCCAESVLQAIAESRGIKSELIPKIATGLCGGVARTGGICGAVSGGVLAINMLAGRNSADQSLEDAVRLVRAFLGEFETKFGTTNCERLIGCRLDTPEGQRFFKENKLREKKCQTFTKEAAGMATRILEQEVQNATTTGSMKSVSLNRGAWVSGRSLGS